MTPEDHARVLDLHADFRRLAVTEDADPDHHARVAEACEAGARALRELARRQQVESWVNGKPR